MSNPLKQSLEKIDEQALTKIQAPENEYGVSLIQASTIEQKPIKWILNGWLAVGKFHVLGGVAGTGKSTIAMSLCAIISSGGLFPDGQQPEKGDVVIWTGEDDPQDTLTPRLKAMGADLDRVHFVGSFCNGDSERPFDPKQDILCLKKRIANLKDIKLLVFDPIVSTIKKDGNSNSDVRNDLTPIAQMAAELGFAVLGITHFSKFTGGNEPLERITGSLAFGAVPRVVWAVTRVKTADESDERILVRIKNNIGKDGDGFHYKVEQTSVDGIDTSKVIWGKAIYGSASKLFQDAEALPCEAKTKIQECIELILQLLSDGPMASKEFDQRCKDSDFSTSTIRNAKEKLRIKPERMGGLGDKGRWEVSLPKPKMLLSTSPQNTAHLNHLSHLSDENWLEGEV